MISKLILVYLFCGLGVACAGTISNKYNNDIQDIRSSNDEIAFKLDGLNAMFGFNTVDKILFTVWFLLTVLLWPLDFSWPKKK